MLSNRKHLGTLIVGNSSNSQNYSRDLWNNSLGNSSSHSSLATHISCIITLARMVNGAKKPTGSNNVAIFFRKFRLVIWKFSSGGFALNVNMSSSESHVIPSVFTVGRGSLLMSTSDALSLIGIFSRSWGELDNHLGACIPALLHRSSNCLYNLIPWLSSNTDSILSSI